MANIMIVDDEEGIRDTLSALVGHSGHSVSAAGSSFEATEMYMDDPVDLVICDMIMPGKGGLETITELRRLNPNLKIIAVSGAPKMGRRRLLEWAKRMGADRTFSKPFVQK